MTGPSDGDSDGDEQLMRRFATGEAAAFEMLYERHERKIWRYLRRGLGDGFGAEDLMQEVWLAVARQAPVYRPDAKFTTWLYTIAHHRLIDALRARRPVVRPSDGGGEDTVEQLPAHRDGEPDAILQASQFTERVVLAVARLPVEQRTALLLHLDAGLSTEEIAGVTDTSFETVKSRLRYARNRLRELLPEDA